VTCADTRALFSALVDDELTAGERAAADAHLSGCAECRYELDRFTRTVAMVQASPPERAPVGFVDRVVDAAHPLPWPRRVARTLFVPLRVKVPMEAAALLLVATTAVWVFQRTPELREAARQEAPVAPAPAPPAVPSPPPRPATPPPVSSRDDARQTPAPLKDEATSVVTQEPASATKDKAERAETIAPREMESGRAEGDAGGLAAGARAPRAPAADSLAKETTQSRLARTGRPDVTATWRVEDRAAATRELELLVTRLGGEPITRRTEGDVEIVDFSVPREAYEDLTNVLEWIGRLTDVRSSGTPRPTVRVSLRVTS